MAEEILELILTELLEVVDGDIMLEEGYDVVGEDDRIGIAAVDETSKGAR